MAKKQKNVKLTDLIPGRDPTSCLYQAVTRYVKANGGSILVIGGIQCQVWPGDLPGTFRIAVKCLGRKPEFKPVEHRPAQKEVVMEKPKRCRAQKNHRQCEYNEGHVGSHVASVGHGDVTLWDRLAQKPKMKRPKTARAQKR